MTTQWESKKRQARRDLDALFDRFENCYQANREISYTHKNRADGSKRDLTVAVVMRQGVKHNGNKS